MTIFSAPISSQRDARFKPFPNPFKSLMTQSSRRIHGDERLSLQCHFSEILRLEKEKQQTQATNKSPSIGLHSSKGSEVWDVGSAWGLMIRYVITHGTTCHSSSKSQDNSRAGQCSHSVCSMTATSWRTQVDRDLRE
eukprot:5284891-Amphidinium_carterae.1